MPSFQSTPKARLTLATQWRRVATRNPWAVLHSLSVPGSLLRLGRAIALREAHGRVVVEELCVTNVAASDLLAPVQRLAHDRIEALALLRGRRRETRAERVPGGTCQRG